MRFVFLFIFCSLIPFYANASRCLQPSEPLDIINKKTKEEAYFIGKIRIDNVVDDFDNPKEVNGIKSYNRLNKVTILQSYKGDVPENIEVYSKVLPEGALERPSPPQFGDVGKVYERSIRKEGDVYYYYFHACEPRINQEMMQEYKQNITSNDIFLREYKKPCDEKGGVFTTQNFESFWDCYLPTTDFGESCQDNSECDGFCMANVTVEEEDTFCKSLPKEKTDGIFECFFEAYYGEIPTKSGTCSEFVNMQGYLQTVVNGKAKRINTETEGKN